MFYAGCAQLSAAGLLGLAPRATALRRLRCSEQPAGAGTPRLRACRRDPADGALYSRAEFLDAYGDLRAWGAAAEAAAATEEAPLLNTDSVPKSGPDSAAKHGAVTAETLASFRVERPDVLVVAGVGGRQSR